MRTTPLLALILTLALVMAACSNDGESSRIASSGESGQDTSPSVETDADGAEAAIAKYTQCLRDEGIDIEDPTVDADGNVHLSPIEPSIEPDGTDLDAIIDTCKTHLEGISTAVVSGDGMTELEDALVEYAQCMRDHGVDMPDPDLSSGGGVIDLGNADEAEFDAADAECRQILAAIGIGG